MESFISKLLSQKGYIYAIFLLVILAFYGNTLKNGFVHDDIWQVATNKNNIFTTCIAEDILGGCQNKGFYYRPMQYVSYLLTNQFSSSATAFHAANLIYFVIASILSYELFKILKIKKIFAFLAVLIFIANPVNSEVLNWVSATPELLFSIFILATIITWIKYLQSKRPVFLFFSLAFFLCALLSKETAVFLFPLTGLYVMLFLKKSQVKFGLLRLFLFLIPLGFYLYLRMSVLGRVVYEYEGYYSLNFWSQVATAIYLYPKYLIKLIYPIPLTFQHNIQPQTYFNLSVLFSLLMVIASFIFIYFLRVKKFNRLIFGFMFIILGILPVLLFINKLGENLFSERYLFLPSVGLSLILADGFEKLIEKLKKKGPVIMNSLLLVFVCYMLVSWWIVVKRNMDWKDNLSSYMAMVKVDPGNKKAHYQLGQIYKDKGDLEQAKNEYLKALNIDPGYAEASQSLKLVTNIYNSKNGLSFYYPAGWPVSEDQGAIRLSSPKNDFQVELTKDENLISDPQGYIDSQKTSGLLIKEGLAQVPNVDIAYVKVFDDSGIKKLQFFLFKGNSAVKILVYPADSALMKEFDNILGSVKIN